MVLQVPPLRALVDLVFSFFPSGVEEGGWPMSPFSRSFFFPLSPGASELAIRPAALFRLTYSAMKRSFFFFFFLFFFFVLGGWGALGWWVCVCTAGRVSVSFSELLGTALTVSAPWAFVRLTVACVSGVEVCGSGAFSFSPSRTFSFFCRAARAEIFPIPTLAFLSPAVGGRENWEVFFSLPLFL